MSLAGEGTVSIWHGIAPEGREDFYAWHTHEHMPERVGIPGFRRGRRYIAVRGEPEFFTLYEAATLETLGGQDYQGRLNSPTPWTMRAVKHFRDVARAIQRVRHSAGPGIGGHLLTLRFESGDTERTVRALCEEALPRIAMVPGISGVHLCEADAVLSGIQTKEKEGREGGTDVPGLTLMIEASGPDLLVTVEADYLAQARLAELGIEAEVKSGIYRLEYIRNKTGFE